MIPATITPPRTTDTARRAAYPAVPITRILTVALFVEVFLSLGGILLTTAELVRPVVLAQLLIVLGAGPFVLAASTWRPGPHGGDLSRRSTLRRPGEAPRRSAAIRYSIPVGIRGSRLAAKPRHGRDPGPGATGRGNELARGPTAHGARRRDRAHRHAGVPSAGSTRTGHSRACKNTGQRSDPDVARPARLNCGARQE